MKVRRYPISSFVVSLPEQRSLMVLFMVPSLLICSVLNKSSLASLTHIPFLTNRLQSVSLESKCKRSKNHCESFRVLLTN